MDSESPKRAISKHPNCKKENATAGDENSVKKVNHSLNVFRLFLMSACIFSHLQMHYLFFFSPKKTEVHRTSHNFWHVTGVK